MWNHLITTALCCLFLVFSACQTSRNSAPELVSGLKNPDEAFAGYDVNADQLRERVLNSTILFYDSVSGSRVAYYDADGKQYHWFPFRKQALVGQWKTEAARPARLTINTTAGRRTREVGSANICFLYEQGVFNPLSGTNGGSWECTPGAQWLWLTEEKANGDVFNLKTTKVPFRLNKRETTIEELKAQCKSCKSAIE